MGSRLHGNDGGGLGSRGWVPVCTGTTVVDWGARDGFPFARERRWWIGVPPLRGSSTGIPFARERRWWVAGFFTPHLPAGGHVGPPLRLVTRASPSSHPSPAPRRGGRVSNPPLRESWGVQRGSDDVCVAGGRGVTLTPALSRQGRGGRGEEGVSYPIDRRAGWS